MRIINQRLADSRKAIIVRGNPAFTRYACAVACVENGGLLHIESFFGQDGRKLRSQASAYMNNFLAGASLGLESPLIRMGMTTTFDTAENRILIASLK